MLWSGQRGSNSLPPPWQGGALPDELCPHIGTASAYLTIPAKIYIPSKPQTRFHSAEQTEERPRLQRVGVVLALPILPGRHQPSIVGRDELNYRVRNGNGWTLILISTNYMSSSTARKQTILYCPSRLLSRHFLSGDPYRIRTDVNGVRGRCLNHLTNGPCRRKKLHSIRFGLRPKLTTLRSSSSFLRKHFAGLRRIQKLSSVSPSEVYPR